MKELADRKSTKDPTPSSAVATSRTGPRSPLEGILMLQRLAGNSAVASWLAGRDTTRASALDTGVVQRWGPAGIGPPAKAAEAGGRPLGSTIWAEYSKVSYDAMQPQDVWEHIGGSIGRKFHGSEDQPGETCAARVSWALNYGGFPISGRGNVNKPGVKYKGKPGDGKRYIVWAPTLPGYLKGRWGKPDAILASAGDAKKLEETLADDEVAVFAGKAHAGVIKKGYDDPYVNGGSVLPVDVWKLPSGGIRTIRAPV